MKNELFNASKWDVDIDIEKPLKSSTDLEGYSDNGNKAEYIVPSTVKAIDKKQFYNHSDLIEVIIPPSVISIGKAAFKKCKKIEKIIIPDSVKKIEIDAFNQCESLKEVRLSNSLTELNAGTFSLCKSLEEVIIPCGVKHLWSAFMACDSLKRVYIPSSVEKIDKDAFWHCNNLTIYCEKNSVAEQYAIKRKIQYVIGQFKNSTVNETVSQLYNSVASDMREKVYYGNIYSAEKILLSICDYAFNSKSNDDIGVSNRIYVDVWVRLKGSISGIGCQLPSEVKGRLLEKYKSFKSVSLEKCIDKSIDIILSNEPKLMQQFAEIEMFNKITEENAAKNKNVENLYIGDNDYGLVANKPIFVNGFGTDKFYLDNLYTLEWVKITYRRTGSLSVEGISGPIDEYEIYSDSNFYCKIYICVYGTTISKVTPKGLVFSNELYPCNKTDDSIGIPCVYASPDIMAGKG